MEHSNTNIHFGHQDGKAPIEEPWVQRIIKEVEKPEKLTQNAEFKQTLFFSFPKLWQPFPSWFLWETDLRKNPVETTTI